MRQQAGIPARITVTDQYGAAAKLNGAQVVAVNGALAVFRHKVNTSIIPNLSEEVLIPDGRVQMRSSFGMFTVRVMVVRVIAEKPKRKTIIVDADFIFITYGFTKDDGRDLDTRTRLVSPIQSADIGWARSRYILSNGLSVRDLPTEGAVVTWGGDNREYGSESAFIDIKKIKSIHGNSPISFECRAFWYNERLRGNCNFLVEVYKGGIVTPYGENFICIGGDLVAELSQTKNVTMNINQNVDGDLVAAVSFDPATNQLTLE